MNVVTKFNIFGSHQPVDGVDGEDCIPPDVRMTMFQTSSYCRH